MYMKKTVVICIFCVLILIGTIYVVKENQKIEKSQPESVAKSTEENVTTEAKLKESMTYDFPYSYLIKEKDGYLVVYEKDGSTIYFESQIPLDELEEKIQAEVKAGKKFTDLEDVYDFLESCSS